MGTWIESLVFRWKLDRLALRYKPQGWDRDRLILSTQWLARLARLDCPNAAGFPSLTTSGLSSHRIEDSSRLDAMRDSVSKHTVENNRRGYLMSGSSSVCFYTTAQTYMCTCILHTPTPLFLNDLSRSVYIDLSSKSESTCKYHYPFHLKNTILKMSIFIWWHGWSDSPNSYCIALVC